ncbi:MAG: methyltransferase domain-containing protein [Burkholderiaceae bacterium]|nr:methyltransferase domain-containing protein [Burkholderiaceae bacterium]
MNSNYLAYAAQNIAIEKNRAALADPMRYIYISPRAVEYHCRHHIQTRKLHGTKLFDWGKLKGGDWDLEEPSSLKTSILADMLREHFDIGVAWQDTNLFAHKMDQIAKRGKIDGCRNRDELLARYARLDIIYDELQNSGHLLSAQERGQPFTDDLFVSIGRDGRFLFAHGGSHRLALAQILNIPLIPVHVVMRHNKWQDIRELALKGYIHNSLKTHPDLNEFISQGQQMTTNKTLQTKVDALTARQNWMHNMALPGGIYTIKHSATVIAPEDGDLERQRKVRDLQMKGTKDGLIYALPLKSKTVLDIACGEGKYSFIAGTTAKHVLGIDIDDIRIEKAKFIKDALDAYNIEFQIMDLYSDAFKALPRFDYALCLGLLHRLPDPFNFISTMAEKAENILFEWKTIPAKLLNHDIPWAYHRPGGLYEWHNASLNFEERAVAAKGRAGGGIDRASYWYMSYAAVEAICQRAGFGYFIRYSRDALYPDHSRNPERTTPRVMLLASRSPVKLMGQSSTKASVK